VPRAHHGEVAPHEAEPVLAGRTEEASVKPVATRSTLTTPIMMKLCLMVGS
jgi:hypothetical protein